MKNITIKMKDGEARCPNDFYFDAYNCIRYCNNKIMNKKDGKYIIISTMKIIPLSNITEITFDKETEIKD